jgi:hypothetical protein
MEKLLALLNKLYGYLVISKVPIPADKQMHFWSGLSGGFLLAISFSWWAVGIIAFLAWLKEFYDYHHPNIHTYDIWDFVATTLGGSVGALIWWAVST